MSWWQGGGSWMALDFATQSQDFRKKGEVKSPVIKESWQLRTLVIFLFILLSVLLISFNFHTNKDVDHFIGTFTSIGFIYLTFKLVLSFFYKPATGEITKEYKISVIIPSYNENPISVISSIKCILAQDYPLHEIIFIDDGSSDKSAYNAVLKLARETNNLNFGRKQPKIIVHQFEQNRGKKEAQLWGFKNSTGDVLMLADSDGYIYPNAIREMLKAFNDEKVTSVVGHISTRNTNDSFITRLQDILYLNAFRVSRAAQSITGSVLVCSGALSMHKRDAIVNNLDEFSKTKIFGIECKCGDDRKLTDLSLKSGGKTKYQSTALCVTDVPTNTVSFFKQQVRWAKSFYVLTLDSLRHAWNKPFMLFWLVSEALIWIIIGTSQFLSLLFLSDNFFLSLLTFTIGYAILLSFINGVYYISKNPLLYLLTPLFSLVHMLVLFPIRLYALLTLNKKGWGTR